MAHSFDKGTKSALFLFFQFPPVRDPKAEVISIHSQEALLIKAWISGGVLMGHPETLHLLQQIIHLNLCPEYSNRNAVASLGDSSKGIDRALGFGKDFYLRIHEVHQP